jgi:hypothetical protein
MKTTILSLLVITSLNISISQQSNFNTQRNWSKNKKEISFGLGATQFLGDLGGRDQEGTDYSLVDLDIHSTSLNVFVAYRYRFSSFWATKTNFSIGMVKGSDGYTQDVIRNSRNLHFRSPIIDIQQRIEFILFANEKYGHRYNIYNTRTTRMYEKNTQFYLFTGVGLTWFNPQARYQGTWVNLRPLSTEGQGYTGGPRKYLPVTANIPFGFGMRWAVSEVWRIGFEATYIKTFTDYMDDVSGEYFYSVSNPPNNPMIYNISNPSNTNSNWFDKGMQRGDDELDAFFYLNFTITKNITYHKPINNKKGKFKGVKTKF